jgi:hypothetical protein
MIDTFRNNISLEHFIRDGENTTISSKSDYVSYREFLKYFDAIKKINRHNLIIGIHFTYGWMPTIFDFRSDNFDSAVHILNRVKSGKELISPDDLILLKGLFNNSLVGTSKLLHFINPCKYAIWDSRVFRYLTNKYNYNQIENPANYLSYLTFCFELIISEEFDTLKKLIESRVGYLMTPLRIVDIIMYENGKKLQRVI